MYGKLHHLALQIVFRYSISLTIPVNRAEDSNAIPHSYIRSRTFQQIDPVVDKFKNSPLSLPMSYIERFKARNDEHFLRHTFPTFPVVFLALVGETRLAHGCKCQGWEVKPESRIKSSAMELLSRRRRRLVSVRLSKQICILFFMNCLYNFF